MKSNGGIRGPRCRVETVFVVSLIVVSCALPALSQGSAQNQRAAQLPEGPGKAAVQAACVGCHDLSRIVDPIGNTPDGWRAVLSMMVGLGASMTPDQINVIQAYLAANFPDKAPRARLVTGPIEATVKEWDLPTAGTRPHDLLVARDGTIWYAGISTHIVGHFDPKTGQFGEYKVRARSGPHSLVEDKQGNIWFTAYRSNYVGKLDPRTGFVTEYKLSDPARSPHSLVLDAKENLFFTTHANNFVGKVESRTGNVTVVRQGPIPYGIVLNSKGIPFFSLFGTNKLGSIDPDTMVIKEYVQPNPDTRPRRVAMTSDDVIWYGDYERGYLGSFDPKTGKHREWPSPSGPGAGIYGITVANDIVWYAEVTVRPNTIVRFDPKTETFQSWAIPSGRVVVRHMMPDKNGNIWFAESSGNRIGYVEVKPAARISSR